MSRLAVLLAGLILGVAASASADDPERAAMARVRLTTEAAVTRGCVRVGSVNDDSVKDLRRKILKAGGNTGLLSFSARDLETIHAEVFRCQGPSPVPRDVPPPPPGPPPPPPPPPGPPPPPPPR